MILEKIKDYVGDDGLLYCGKCKSPKEFEMTVGDMIKKFVVICNCQDKIDKHDLQKLNEIERLRNDCIKCPKNKKARFDIAEVSQDNKQAYVIAKNFAIQWDKTKEAGICLLLHGKSGSGKTFLAACIANSLVDKGIKAMFINCATFFDMFMLSSNSEKREILDEVNNCPLLIIDDFGVERETSAMQERVYQILNARSESELPMVITTNIPIDDIKNPKNVYQSRIFGRIHEKMIPVKMNDMDFRKNSAIKNYKDNISWLKSEIPPERK